MPVCFHRDLGLHCHTLCPNTARSRTTTMHSPDKSLSFSPSTSNSMSPTAAYGHPMVYCAMRHDPRSTPLEQPITPRATKGGFLKTIQSLNFHLLKDCTGSAHYIGWFELLSLLRCSCNATITTSTVIDRLSSGSQVTTCFQRVCSSNKFIFTLAAFLF